MCDKNLCDICKNCISTEGGYDGLIVCTVTGAESPVMEECGDFDHRHSPHKCHCADCFQHRIIWLAEQAAYEGIERMLSDRKAGKYNRAVVLMTYAEV